MFLPCSGYFITCMSAHIPTVKLDNVIRFSSLFRISEFRGIVPNEPVSLVVSFNIYMGLKCKHVVFTPTYVTAILQLHPSLGNLEKLFTPALQKKKSSGRPVNFFYLIQTKCCFLFQMLPSP